MVDKRTGKMHVGLFLKMTGHHMASWRHPKAAVDDNMNVDHWVKYAVAAESAGLDFIFLADSAATRPTSNDILSMSAQYTGYFEPTTLFAAVAMMTKRIGLVCTSTTSYNEPYHVARRYASLDHISHGRAGWNVVVSGNLSEAFNFGRDQHLDHEFAYERALEFVDVCKGLWDSWDDDAFIYDRANGRFFDPAKLHDLNHVGKHFKIKGPLNAPRPVQGYPVLFMAGSSDTGREAAAAIADGMFTAELSRERSIDLYRDVKGRLPKYGRKPSDQLIMPGCSLFVGRTAKEAQEKKAYLQSLIHPVVGREFMATLTGVDLSDVDVDEKFPDRPSSRAQHGISQSIISLAKEQSLTIRQLYERLAASHGKLTMEGSVQEVADQMQEWFDSYACDGFILQPSVLPVDEEEIVQLLIPELQNRGLIRTGYEGATLREHMGLARPESRYAHSALTTAAE